MESSALPTAPISFDGGIFEVRLDLFDGPIDLLLHLVKQRELPIEQLSLAQVANQFCQCLERMRELDIEVAAEYLVVAATLLSIKASVLLDGKNPDNLESDEESLPDPHRELLQKLREAAIFKDTAASLSHRHLLGIDVFSRPHGVVAHADGYVIRYDTQDVMLLGQALQRLLSRSGPTSPLLEIRLDSVTIVERMLQVLDTLRVAGGKVDFAKLIPDVTSRASIVTTLLALLELCKRRAICVRQEQSYEQIYVALGEEELGASQVTSEFDQPSDSSDSEANIVNG